jgi:hypothetical protein
LSYFRDTEEKQAEYLRRRAAYDLDPVRTSKLTEFVGASLRDAEAVLGGTQGLQPFLASVDPAVMKQIQTELARA